MRIADHPIQIGKFPVVRRLGVGAMGEVFLCIQAELERPVAVKVMHGGTAQWPRFQREARSAAKLAHPNVIRVYDVGLDYESPYIVMEFVDGQPLSELIGTNVLTLPVILRLAYHISDALEAARQQSVVHRDLKPSNILIDTQGRPRLVDFGLAKSLLQDPSLSGSGDLIGTPRYMAPEQILGDNQELDHRVDIFALGVVMYEMLAGRPPFDGQNVAQIMRQVTDEEPADLVSLNSTIPEQVAAITRKALSKRREDRFQSAAEMRAALRDVLLSQTFASSDGSLRASEYLSSFVPASSITTRRHVLKDAARRRWAGMIAIGVILGGGWFGWWWNNRLPGRPVVIARMKEFESRKAKLYEQVGRTLRGDFVAMEQTTPRDVVRENLDDAISLAKFDPDDDALRLATARLLRRGGEFLAAGDECTTVLKRHPESLEAHTERLLARTQLYALYLGCWNDRLLCYPARSLLVEDIRTLQDSEDAELRHVADLVDQLAGKPVENVQSLASFAPKNSNPYVSAADVAALHVELLYREAESAPAKMALEEEGRWTSGRLADAARRQLRNGLASDPSHISLIFLQAASFARQSGAGDVADREDWNAAIKRSTPQFEASMEQLWRVALRQGCDTSIARAILLANRTGMSSAASQHLQDALSCRPTVSQLHAARTWLHLHSPDDERHAADLRKQLLDDLEEKCGLESAEFTPFFVAAALYAGRAQFMEANSQLRICRSKYRTQAGWLSLETAHQRWLDAADESYTAFLYATRPVLAELPVATDVAMELHSELLNRLADEAVVAAEKLSVETVRDYRAGTHFTLAVIYANLLDRYEVLNHLRQALEQRSPEVTPEICRRHRAFTDWAEDEGFENMYRACMTSVGKRLGGER